MKTFYTRDDAPDGLNLGRKFIPKAPAKKAGEKVWEYGQYLFYEFPKSNQYPINLSFNTKEIRRRYEAGIRVKHPQEFYLTNIQGDSMEETHGILTRIEEAIMRMAEITYQNKREHFEIRLNDKDGAEFEDVFQRQTGQDIKTIGGVYYSTSRIVKLDKNAYENIYGREGEQLSYLKDNQLRNVVLI